jgi:hypothetical protein
MAPSPPAECSIKTEAPMVLLTSTPRVHVTEDLVLFEAPNDEAGRPPYHKVLSICHLPGLQNTNHHRDHTEPGSSSSLIVGGEDRLPTNTVISDAGSNIVTMFSVPFGLILLTEGNVLRFLSLC